MKKGHKLRYKYQGEVSSLKQTQKDTERAIETIETMNNLVTTMDNKKHIYQPTKLLEMENTLCLVARSVQQEVVVLIPLQLEVKLTVRILSLVINLDLKTKSQLVHSTKCK